MPPLDRPSLLRRRFEQDGVIVVIVVSWFSSLGFFLGDSYLVRTKPRVRRHVQQRFPS
jgi:hypothetical protein